MRRALRCFGGVALLLVVVAGIAKADGMIPRDCPASLSTPMHFEYTWHSPNYPDSIVPPATENFTTGGSTGYTEIARNTQTYGIYSFGDVVSDDQQAVYRNTQTGAVCWYDVTVNGNGDTTEVSNASWGNWVGTFAWLYWTDEGCDGPATEDAAASVGGPSASEPPNSCTPPGGVGGDGGGAGNGGSGGGGGYICAYLVWYDGGGNEISEELIGCWYQD